MTCGSMAVTSSMWIACSDASEVGAGMSCIDGHHSTILYVCSDLLQDLATPT